MEKFIEHEGIVAVLNRVNVDTDQIIPKQFLKRIERTGFGQFLFFDWRFNADGSLNMQFELNQPAAHGASILLADHNFGCGSSREHAPWALQDYGFRVIIAPNFADIFYTNCLKNGMLPITLPEQQVYHLMELINRQSQMVRVNLSTQQVEIDGLVTYPFEIDNHWKHMLLNGMDEIEQTLQLDDKITAYEQQTKV